jgi:hypothetical protein
MLEMALAALLVAVALFAVGGRAAASSESPERIAFGTRGDGADLPCPWCRAQTSESDHHCPSCGQRFG